MEPARRGGILRDASLSFPMDDPRLQHVTREAAARGRAPGWRAQPPGGGSRLFSDADHGSPGAALDAALAWRDEQLTAETRVPLPTARVTLAPGIYLMAQRSRGRAYPVVRAEARDADGTPQTLVRSLLKHTPDSAIREAAEHRYQHRAGASRFDHPSADALYADALAAFRQHTAEP